MIPLRRYLSKVCYHFDSVLKNVAYSFRIGQKLTAISIEPISLNFSIVVSDSIICQSLVDSITKEALDDAVSTIMAYFRRCPHHRNLYYVQNSRVH